MTPDELKSASIKIWGERGWTTALASALGVDRTQVWRYLNGKTAVPGPVSAAMRCWIKRFDETGDVPRPEVK